MSVEPIVRLDDVSKAYRGAQGPTPVLEGVDLTIHRGEKASLIGPSGSGKSTLLSLIAGLLRPDTGTVAIDGLVIDDLDDGGRARLRANRIGIALQSDNLIPFLTARENVELAVAFAGHMGRGAARARADELLDRFGVLDRASHRPRRLSGGEAQRVALAVSVANEPDLLLADEVVAQLDGDTAARVVDAVLHAEFAVLFVSHDVALSNLVANRYELVDRGIRRR